MDRTLFELVCARLRGQKIAILDNADHIVFEVFDCDGVADESFVWLYLNDVAVAFVEIESIIAVTVYPWPYAKEDGATIGRFGE